MAILFSGKGRKRLEEIAKPRLLCAFDFDGTLAPLVAVPDNARLPEHIRKRLLALSAYAPIAVITGRSLADIRTRVGFDPDFIVGNHGLEGVPGWEAESAQHRDLCAGWMNQLTGILKQQLDDPGVQLEDKRYSLSVHYRMARAPQQAARTLESLFGQLSPPPRVVGGKYVFNLVAENAADKGVALERLMQACGARHAIYVGDDVTDEDVFRLRRPDVLSVRVERHPESAADFFLERPDDIVQLLDELIERLRAANARNWVHAEVGSNA